MNTPYQDPQFYRKWKWMAPLGLTLIGAGLSLIGEGIVLKIQGDAFWPWFVMGTLGLSVTNAGISIFGDALKRRIWMEMSEQADVDSSETPSK